MKPTASSHRRTPWAILADVLPVVSAVLAAEESPELNADAVTLDREAASDSVTTAGGVAILPLRGVITSTPSLISLLFGGGGSGLVSFRRRFRDAMASDDVSAVLLDINSPGGSTDLIRETAAEIFGARGDKPIVAIANTRAASAAYWIASQADEVVVTPSGDIGSIGVFATHWDYSEAYAAEGMKPTLISAGKYKVEGNPYEPLSEEAEAALQADVDTFYDAFVEDVARGRSASAAAVRSGYGEGRLVLAEQAVSLGMADRVESYEETIQRLSGRPRSTPSSTRSESEVRTGIRALQLAQPRRH